MGRKQLPFFFPKLLFHSLLHLYCMHGSHWMAWGTVTSFRVHDNQFKINSLEGKNNTLLPLISPNQAPQPFIPLGAPPPLAPFTNDSVPKLSGRCIFNFSSLDTVINTTAVDCSAFFAPFLANVVCCPQIHAILTILAAQSSKDTGKLALDMTNANHCLADVQAILAGRGANNKLRRICYVGPLNLTEASCPISSVNEFESLIDTTRLLTACKKVDAVNECCSQICQNEILDAATRIAFKVEDVSKNRSGEHSPVIDDCKLIVHRWLASKLDPLSANQVLRRISNCNLNKVCPLIFPETSSVTRYCEKGVENKTACCIALGSYVSHLQQQSFITNIQALHCAASLGSKLQRANVTTNVYDLCHIALKDFSLQVGSQESGCLLPSLPSDATFDQTSGIGFTCDLNDNIAAPWSSAPEQRTLSSCNKTIKLPALPANTSDYFDPKQEYMKLYVLLASAITTLMFTME